MRAGPSQYRWRRTPSPRGPRLPGINPHLEPAYGSFVQRLFTGSPAERPDAAARSLSATSLKAPVLRRAQRSYGNRASQQIVMRARALQRKCDCGGTCTKCQEEDAQSHVQESAQPAASQDAPAYTSGRDSYFAAGMYTPASTSLAHVVQRSPAIQRQTDPQAGNAPIRVESLVARDCPSLLGVLPVETLAHWQAILDTDAYNRRLRAQEAAVTKRYQKEYPGPEAAYRYLSSYVEAIDRIESKQKTYDPHDQWAQVEPAAILDPDVMAQTPWNRAAEKEFRQWLYERFVSYPVNAQLDLNEQDPRITLWWRRVTLPTTHGYVTFANLMEFNEFKNEYQEKVQNSVLIRETREGMDSVRGFVNHWSYLHHERSAANYPEGESYWDSVHRVMARYYRRTAELLGKGSAPYPKLAIWGRPNLLLEQAHKLFDAGQFELAAAALEMASEEANSAVAQFSAYETRIVSGVERTVTVLKGVRFAGKVAATLLPGGVLARGAYTAGYSVIEESSVHAVELGLGQRSTFGGAEILKEGAMEGVLSMLGDVTVGEFTNALKLRFGARLASEYGESLAEKIIQTGAVATAAPWNAAAAEVMNQIVLGKVSVRSLDDLGDLITSRVMSDVGMLWLMSPVAKYMHGGGDKDPVSEPEVTGKRESGAPEPPRPEVETKAPADEVAKAEMAPAGPSAVPGHEIKVTASGKLVRCSTVCELLGMKYRAVLDRDPQLRQALEGIEANAKKLGPKRVGERARALEEAILDRAMIEVLKVGSVPESEMPALREFIRQNPEQMDRLEPFLEAKERVEARETIDVPTQTEGVNPAAMKTVRQGATTDELRDWVNQVGKYVPGMADPALPGRVLTTRLQADHIFALKRIFQQAGFGDLSVEEMLSIARYKGNFAGLSASANPSKGAKSYAEWLEHKRSGTKVDPKFRYDMYLREIEAEDDLGRLIEWVRANGPLPTNMKPRDLLIGPKARPNPLKR